ncbi:MAG TPA: hypothetical protein VH877_17935 [Polyangia bacterium]|nr:hypothetical protein [Polyangia bacterium]
MTQRRNIGICHLCRGEFTKSAMSRHVPECPSRRPGTEPHFLLLVDGSHAPMFWMHLEVKMLGRLADLDRFLRRHWLECCDHESVFYINEAEHPSRYSLTDPRGMGIPIGRVISFGSAFDYLYDFDDATKLRLRVFGQCSGPPVRDGVRLLGRNLPPHFACQRCGKPAERICPECGDDGWLCGRCAATHACGKEGLLRVLNSPRVGTCAYGRRISREPMRGR